MINEYKIDHNIKDLLNKMYDELSPLELLEVSRYFLDKILSNSNWWDFDTREDYKYFNFSIKKIINEIKKVEEM